MRPVDSRRHYSVILPTHSNDHNVSASASANCPRSSLVVLPPLFVSLHRGFQRICSAVIRDMLSNLMLLYLSTSCGWEGKGRYGSFRLRMNVWVCRWNCEIPWEHAPYLSASAVVIHYEEALYQVYAPLPLYQRRWPPSIYKGPHMNHPC